MIQPRQMGQALRRAREAWGLPPAELAQRAAVPGATVKAAERSGQAPLTELAALAAALGGSVDDLLAGRDFWHAMSIAWKTSEASFERSLVRARVIALASAANIERSLAGFLGLPQQWDRGAVLGPVGLEDDQPREGLRSEGRGELQRFGESLFEIVHDRRSMILFMAPDWSIFDLAEFGSGFGTCALSDRHWR